MMNLENVTIHQFRGLRDLELKDLGRINLLVGINNSGKTSVIEALSIIQVYYNSNLSIAIYVSGGTDLIKNLKAKLTVLETFPRTSPDDH